MTFTIRLLTVVCFIFATLPLANSQITGGRYVFQTLALSPSARITGLGGAQIAVQDADPAFAYQNPAALNPSMHNRLVFNHNFYLADIQHGQAAYARHLEKIGFTLMGGIQYIDFGDISRADEFGTVTGTIPAGETTVTLGAARKLAPKLTMGLNVKTAFSTLDVNKSSALGADIGLMYADTARRLMIGLVMRNMGTQINTYNDTRENLPYDVQVGVTKRLKYMPFRLGIVFHHLHDWKIRFDDPNIKDDDALLIGGEEEPNTENTTAQNFDNFFRHIIFNGEFLIGKKEGFKIRFGYNHLRKRELSVNNYRSLAGFSGGVSLKINRFYLDTGFGTYHLAGGVFHVGLGTNFSDFRKG